ncbi:MAG: ABC transporter ATP-binding protein [Actinomycetota bacterium]
MSVSFERVSFRYPGSSTWVLDDVTLTVPEGTFVLVTGPTGAGKSTLLRAINGLVPQFSGGEFFGHVVVDGRDTSSHAPRELSDVVAFVPQDPGASFVVDRVEDELAYAMENLGVDPTTMRRRVEEVLDLLGIEDLRTRSVRSLSGGERQRVAIAAALTPGPRTLVLDEPTSQLDPQGAEDVLAALQRMVHDLGLTVVMAEHRLERVAGFADLAIGCGGGRAVLGDPSDIIERFAAGPPVARLGRMAGWSPVPLTVRSARRSAPRELPAPVAARGPEKGPVLLEARELHAGYGGADVLHGIDLDLHQGEIVALMGRNGSGKSTLLRCLVGLHHPDRGAVTTQGGPPEPGRTVALCPQIPESILFKESVIEEVEATVTWTGSGSLPEAVLQSLGLSGRAERHPRDLSSGERLLVATAATVAGGAPVLLLDEPTRGLDLPSKERLGSFLREHARHGAVIFATHDVEMAAELATRVVMLAGGEVISDGLTAQVLGDSVVFAPQMTRVFGPGWMTVEQVMSALDEGARDAGEEVSR